MLIAPVSITRYWEFPFALRHLPARHPRCLDVSSPRVFALYVASRRQPVTVQMINPDVRDAEVTRRLAARARIDGIQVSVAPVSAIAGARDQFDAIWSISVVEHIANDGDIDAMRIMYDALVPGGRLVVTVPVDRTFWTEYRGVDVYRLGLEPESEGTFFQRWYDATAIADRLVRPLGPSTVELEWFGELNTGTFSTYVAEWLREGLPRTVEDAREIADRYAEFDSWEAMPGQGVCGMSVTKTAAKRRPA